MLPKRLLLVAAAALLVGAAHLARQVSRGPSDAPPQTATAPRPAAAPAAPAASTEPQAPPRAAPEAPATPGGTRAGAITSSAAGGPEDVATPAPSLQAQISASSSLTLDEANRLYDRAEYEEARALALAVLRERPDSVRMRRIVVSTSCIMGEQELAQTHYRLLPATDRADMRRRCARYGSTFAE